jgi:hypothetical protein
MTTPTMPLSSDRIAGGHMLGCSAYCTPYQSVASANASALTIQNRPPETIGE